MATPICANDAADIDSTTSANNSVRMKRICIVISPALVPRWLGDDPMTRVAWIEGLIFGRNALHDCISLASSSDRDFLISAVSKSEQKSTPPPFPVGH